jgi:hypothetical protein
VLDKGKMSAFGNRRDIAGKIRNGRTVIPVGAQIITARKRAKQLGHEGSSKQSRPITTDGLEAGERGERVVS